MQVRFGADSPALAAAVNLAHTRARALARLHELDGRSARVARQVAAISVRRRNAPRWRVALRRTLARAVEAGARELFAIELEVDHLRAAYYPTGGASR